MKPDELSRGLWGSLKAVQVRGDDQKYEREYLLLGFFPLAFLFATFIFLKFASVAATCPADRGFLRDAFISAECSRASVDLFNFASFKTSLWAISISPGGAFTWGDMNPWGDALN
jgi:hypothetical protein